jgi:phosphatidylglycerol---prolipoprotein diacylglyceryl transferase
VTPQRFAYAAFMLLAAVVFFGVRRWLPPISAVASLPRLHRFSLAAAGFVGGIFGARLPFILGTNTDSTVWLADGKTITTGLIGAYLTVEIVKVLLGVKVKTGDSFALPLAAAVAVGRWGCFFNGCCAGTETGLLWGVDFGDGVKRHPTQIYESLFHLGMAFVVGSLIARRRIPGHRLQMYLIGYAVYRFTTEFIRPEPVVAWGLTFYQWAAAVLGIGLAVQWTVERRRERRLIRSQFAAVLGRAGMLCSQPVPECPPPPAGWP